MILNLLCLASNVLQLTYESQLQLLGCCLTRTLARPRPRSARIRAYVVLCSCQVPACPPQMSILQSRRSKLQLVSHIRFDVQAVGMSVATEVKTDRKS
jgi:hypothetical protein